MGNEELRQVAPELLKPKESDGWRIGPAMIDFKTGEVLRDIQDTMSGQVIRQRLVDDGKAYGWHDDFDPQTNLWARGDEKIYLPKEQQVAPIKQPVPLAPILGTEVAKLDADRFIYRVGENGGFEFFNAEAPNGQNPWVTDKTKATRADGHIGADKDGNAIVNPSDPVFDTAYDKGDDGKHYRQVRAGSVFKHSQEALGAAASFGMDPKEFERRVVTTVPLTLDELLAFRKLKSIEGETSDNIKLLISRAGADPGTRASIRSYLMDTSLREMKKQLDAVGDKVKTNGAYDRLKLQKVFPQFFGKTREEKEAKGEFVGVDVTGGNLLGLGTSAFRAFAAAALGSVLSGSDTYSKNLAKGIARPDTPKDLGIIGKLVAQLPAATSMDPAAAASQELNTPTQSELSAFNELKKQFDSTKDPVKKALIAQEIADRMGTEGIAAFEARVRGGGSFLMNAPNLENAPFLTRMRYKATETSSEMLGFMAPAMLVRTPAKSLGIAAKTPQALARLAGREGMTALQKLGWKALATGSKAVTERALGTILAVGFESKVEADRFYSETINKALETGESVESAINTAIAGHGKVLVGNAALLGATEWLTSTNKFANALLKMGKRDLAKQFVSESFRMAERRGIGGLFKETVKVLGGVGMENVQEGWQRAVSELAGGSDGKKTWEAIKEEIVNVLPASPMMAVLGGHGAVMENRTRNQVIDMLRQRGITPTEANVNSILEGRRPGVLPKVDESTRDAMKAEYDKVSAEIEQEVEKETAAARNSRLASVSQIEDVLDTMRREATTKEARDEVKYLEKALRPIRKTENWAQIEAALQSGDLNAALKTALSGMEGIGSAQAEVEKLREDGKSEEQISEAMAKKYGPRVKAVSEVLLRVYNDANTWAKAVAVDRVSKDGRFSPEARAYMQYAAVAGVKAEAKEQQSEAAKPEPVWTEQDLKDSWQEYADSRMEIGGALERDMPDRAVVGERIGKQISDVATPVVEALKKDYGVSEDAISAFLDMNLSASSGAKAAAEKLNEQFKADRNLLIKNNFVTGDGKTVNTRAALNSPSKAIKDAATRLVLAKRLNDAGFSPSGLAETRSRTVAALQRESNAKLARRIAERKGLTGDKADAFVEAMLEYGRTGIAPGESTPYAEGEARAKDANLEFAAEWGSSRGWRAADMQNIMAASNFAVEALIGEARRFFAANPLGVLDKERWWSNQKHVVNHVNRRLAELGMTQRIKEDDVPFIQATLVNTGKLAYFTESSEGKARFGAWQLAWRALQTKDGAPVAVRTTPKEMQSERGSKVYMLIDNNRQLISERGVGRIPNDEMQAVIDRANAYKNIPAIGGEMPTAKDMADQLLAVLKAMEPRKLVALYAYHGISDPRFAAIMSEGTDTIGESTSSDLKNGRAIRDFSTIAAIVNTKFAGLEGKWKGEDAKREVENAEAEIASKVTSINKLGEAAASELLREYETNGVGSTGANSIEGALNGNVEVLAQLYGLYPPSTPILERGAGGGFRVMWDGKGAPSFLAGFQKVVNESNSEPLREFFNRMARTINASVRTRSVHAESGFDISNRVVPSAAETAITNRMTAEQGRVADYAAGVASALNTIGVRSVNEIETIFSALARKALMASPSVATRVKNYSGSELARDVEDKIEELAREVGEAFRLASRKLGQSASDDVAQIARGVMTWAETRGMDLDTEDARRSAKLYANALSQSLIQQSIFQVMKEVKRRLQKGDGSQFTSGWALDALNKLMREAESRQSMKGVRSFAAEAMAKAAMNEVVGREGLSRAGGAVMTVEDPEQVTFKREARKIGTDVENTGEVEEQIEAVAETEEIQSAEPEIEVRDQEMEEIAITALDLSDRVSGMSISDLAESIKNNRYDGRLVGRAILGMLYRKRGTFEDNESEAAFMQSYYDAITDWVSGLIGEGLTQEQIKPSITMAPYVGKNRATKIYNKAALIASGKLAVGGGRFSEISSQDESEGLTDEERIKNAEVLLQGVDTIDSLMQRYAKALSLTSDSDPESIAQIVGLERSGLSAGEIPFEEVEARVAQLEAAAEELKRSATPAPSAGAKILGRMSEADRATFELAVLASDTDLSGQANALIANADALQKRIKAIEKKAKALTINDSERASELAVELDTVVAAMNAANDSYQMVLEAAAARASARNGEVNTIKRSIAALRSVIKENTQKRDKLMDELSKINSRDAAKQTLNKKLIEHLKGNEPLAFSMMGIARAHMNKAGWLAATGQATTFTMSDGRKVVAPAESDAVMKAVEAMRANGVVNAMPSAARIALRFAEAVIKAGEKAGSKSEANRQAEAKIHRDVAACEAAIKNAYDGIRANAAALMNSGNDILLPKTMKNQNRATNLLADAMFRQRTRVGSMKAQTVKKIEAFIKKEFGDKAQGILQVARAISNRRFEGLKARRAKAASAEKLNTLTEQLTKSLVDGDAAEVDRNTAAIRAHLTKVTAKSASSPAGLYRNIVVTAQKRAEVERNKLKSERDANMQAVAEMINSMQAQAVSAISMLDARRGRGSLSPDAAGKIAAITQMTTVLAEAEAMARVAGDNSEFGRLVQDVASSMSEVFSEIMVDTAGTLEGKFAEVYQGTTESRIRDAADTMKRALESIQASAALATEPDVAEVAVEAAKSHKPVALSLAGPSVVMAGSMMGDPIVTSLGAAMTAGTLGIYMVKVGSGMIASAMGMSPYTPVRTVANEVVARFGRGVKRIYTGIKNMIRSMTHTAAMYLSDVFDRLATSTEDRRSDGRGNDRRNPRTAALRRGMRGMTREQMQAIMTTSSVTGLPNKTAYAFSPRKPHVAFIDADGLKWVNDTMGHEAGNALLKKIADVLREVGLGDDSYHVSGDEFYSESDDPAALDAKLKEAQRLLGTPAHRMTAVGNDGAEYNFHVGFSYGIGQDPEGGERAAQQQKDQRQLAGLRAGRGEAPPGTVRSDRWAEGNQGGRSLLPGEAEAVAKKVDNLTANGDGDVTSAANALTDEAKGIVASALGGSPGALAAAQKAGHDAWKAISHVYQKMKTGRTPETFGTDSDTRLTVDQDRLVRYSNLFIDKFAPHAVWANRSEQHQEIYFRVADMANYRSVMAAMSTKLQDAIFDMEQTDNAEYGRVQNAVFTMTKLGDWLSDDKLREMFQLSDKGIELVNQIGAFYNGSREDVKAGRLGGMKATIMNAMREFILDAKAENDTKLKELYNRRDPAAQGEIDDLLDANAEMRDQLAEYEGVLKKNRYYFPLWREGDASISFYKNTDGTGVRTAEGERIGVGFFNTKTGTPTQAELDKFMPEFLKQLAIDMYVKHIEDTRHQAKITKNSKLQPAHNLSYFEDQVRAQWERGEIEPDSPKMTNSAIKEFVAKAKAGGAIISDEMLRKVIVDSDHLSREQKRDIVRELSYAMGMRSLDQALRDERSGIAGYNTDLKNVVRAQSFVVGSRVAAIQNMPTMKRALASMSKEGRHDMRDVTDAQDYVMGALSAPYSANSEKWSAFGRSALFMMTLAAKPAFGIINAFTQKYITSYVHFQAKYEDLAPAKAAHRIAGELVIGMLGLGDSLHSMSDAELDSLISKSVNEQAVVGALINKAQVTRVAKDLRDLLRQAVRSGIFKESTTGFMSGFDPTVAQRLMDEYRPANNAWGMTKQAMTYFSEKSEAYNRIRDFVAQSIYALDEDPKHTSRGVYTPLPKATTADKDVAVLNSYTDLMVQHRRELIESGRFTGFEPGFDDAVRARVLQRIRFEAEQATALTNFSSTPANMEKSFRSPLGRLLVALRMFPVRTIGLAAESIRVAKTLQRGRREKEFMRIFRPYIPVLKACAFLLAFGGAAGIPGEDEALDVISLIWNKATNDGISLNRMWNKFYRDAVAVVYEAAGMDERNAKQRGQVVADTGILGALNIGIGTQLAMGDMWRTRPGGSGQERLASLFGGIAGQKLSDLIEIGSGDREFRLTDYMPSMAGRAKDVFTGTLDRKLDETLGDSIKEQTSFTAAERAQSALGIVPARKAELFKNTERLEEDRVQARRYARHIARLVTEINEASRDNDVAKVEQLQAELAKDFSGYRDRMIKAERVDAIPSYALVERLLAGPAKSRLENLILTGAVQF